MGGGHAGNGFGSVPDGTVRGAHHLRFPTRMGRQEMQVINLRKVTAALGVTALATVVAALTAAPAQAAPAAGAGSTRDAAVTSAAPTSSDGAGFRADHAEAYWTAKRMRSARSAQAPADATATSGAAARQATGAPGSTPATTAERPTNLPAGAAQAM